MGHGRSLEEQLWERKFRRYQKKLSDGQKRHWALKKALAHLYQMEGPI